jgi:dienelactone hydrolase
MLLACLCWSGIARTEEISVPVDYQGRQIQLFGIFQKPPGPGPFPVVIALHSCSGYSSNMYYGSLPGWVGFLQQQGYATFKFDSFTARGYSDVCERPADVSAGVRAGDVLAAANLLAARADIRADRIAAIGFSHGGGTAVYVARDHEELRPARQQLAARGGRLVASVGVYPGCGSPDGNRVIVPLLVLAGGSDDWTPAADCVALGDHQAGAPITVQVYPGAYHAFDVQGSRPIYKLGHLLAYDAAATADAHIRVTEFLRRCMQ